MSLAGYSDKHGLSPEKWDLPVPSWAIAEDHLTKLINDVGHYIGREGIAHQKKRGRIPRKFFT